MKKKGFTLLELVVVMVLIGILASIAFSRFTSKTDHAYRLVTTSARHLIEANLKYIYGRYLEIPASAVCIENHYDTGSLWVNGTLNETTNKPRITTYGTQAVDKCNKLPPSLTNNPLASDEGCKLILQHMGNIERSTIGTYQDDIDVKEWLAWKESISSVDYCVFYNVPSRYNFHYNFTTGDLSVVYQHLGDFTRPTAP